MTAPAGVGNRNKARGTRAERRVKELLETDGYIAFRVAGSLGPADLVALKSGQCLLVQVKTESRLGRAAHVGPAEWNALRDTAALCGGLPIVAVVGFRCVDWWQLTGPKDRVTKSPPWARWRADEVAL